MNTQLFEFAQIDELDEPVYEPEENSEKPAPSFEVSLGTVPGDAFPY